VTVDRSSDTAKKRHAGSLERLFDRDNSIIQSCAAEITEILHLLDGPALSWPQRQKNIESRLKETERCKQQLALAVQTQSM